MLSQFLRNSLRAKVLVVFIIFGLLFAFEGALVVIFWNKAGAVSRQIEIVGEAAQSNQQAHASFRQFILGQQNNLPGDAAGLLESENKLLNTLLTGGIAGSSKLNIDPTSLHVSSILEKIIQKQEKQKKTLVNLSAQKVALDSAKTLKAYDSTNLVASQRAVAQASQYIVRGMIEMDGLAKTLMEDYRQVTADLRLEEKSRQSQLAWLIMVIVLIDMTVLGYLFFLMSKKIFKPLEEIANAAKHQQLSKTHTTDELGVVSTNLNAIIHQLEDATVFINTIGEGNLDAQLVGENENTLLSKALLSMQQKLKAINEEERKRKWANEGLAKFVEILRSGESNLSALGDDIIKALVNYTGATQGGLYVWNDDQPDNAYIELVSSYAFNRKKHEKKKVMAGEGLLGQVYLEKITKYITEIPHDYFRIVSGLGETDPQAILIVPLLSDNNAYGIVELASFKKFEAYEIAFVEKLGETLASTLSSVKTNEKNRRLLRDFQEQTESLRSQEEEMRQNMEELTATQEEMSRKENDYIRQIEELQGKLKQASADGQWDIARQASEALQTNLQALDISLKTLRK